MIGYYVGYAPAIGWFAVVYNEHGRNVTMGGNEIRAVRWRDAECTAFDRCIAMCGQH